MDTWMNVAIVGVIIVVVLCWFDLKNLKSNAIPLVVRICEMLEIIVIACIIGNVVEKIATKDEKVKEPLPVTTNECLRVSGTLTFHVMEVEKHEPQK